MYNAVVGTCAQQGAAAGGGGGVASVSVATSASGNYDNAVEIILVNGQAVSNGQNPQASSNFSNGILGGAQSTFGTASSPTRTTQTITASAADYLSSWNAAGTGNGDIHIGGYLRSNNFTTANKEGWSIASTAILSQSFSTGVSVTVSETYSNRTQIRDNTFGTHTTGLSHFSNHGFSSGSGFYGMTIQHASGRGAATLPQAGDTLTFRLSVTDQDLSTTYTAIHDVTITWA
jgi:hypothetical protein